MFVKARSLDRAQNNGSILACFLSDVKLKNKQSLKSAQTNKRGLLKLFEGSKIGNEKARGRVFFLQESTNREQ